MQNLIVFTKLYVMDDVPDILNSNYENLEIFGDDKSKIKTLRANIEGIDTDLALCEYGFVYCY